MAAFYPLSAVGHPIQSDFRQSEAPHCTPDPESLFACPVAPNYQWVYQR